MNKADRGGTAFGRTVMLSWGMAIAALLVVTAVEAACELPAVAPICR